MSEIDVATAGRGSSGTQDSLRVSSRKGTRAVRRFRWLDVGAAAGALVVALTIGLPAAAADAGRVLRAGHSGDADSLDHQVAISSSAITITTDLVEGLYTMDNDGNPVLGAAESVRASRDATGPVLEFTLRANLKWSDGKPLTARDFEYSLKRLADPKTTATAIAENLRLVRNGESALRGRLPPDSLGVRALDDRRLRMEMVRHAAWWPSVLALPAFAPVPRHVIERRGSEWSRSGSHVSNGPFMLAEWKANNSVRVVKNPHFRDAASVSLDAVQYLPVLDLNSALQMFRSGQLDTMVNFPPQKLDLIRQEMPRSLRLAPSLGVTVYVMNLNRPAFRDVRVRRALALAIDRDVLTTRIVRTGDVPAYGLLPPSVLGGLPGLAPVPSSQAARVALARQLLEEAGYGPGNPLKFELLFHTNEEHKSVAIAAVAMWRAIGAQATSRNAERRVVEAAANRGDFDMVRSALFSPYPDAHGLLVQFISQSSAISGGYRSEKFDAALAASEAESASGAKRATLQRRAEQLLMNDQPVVPLYFATSKRLVSDRVIGWPEKNLTAFRPARYLSVRP